MKSFKIVAGIFAVVGVGMLIGAFWSFNSAKTFIANGIVVSGEVLDLTLNTSGESATYVPIVEFTTRDGQTIEYISSVGSNPPGYEINEQVEIIYDPTSPYNAKINAFWDLWFGVFIFGFMGVIFSAFGFGFLYVFVVRPNQRKKLMNTGMAIHTEFVGVEKNTRLTVNRKNPYQIVSRWMEGDREYIFRSKNFWRNPSEYVNKEQKITVWVDPNNKKKYYMDVSFLPGGK